MPNRPISRIVVLALLLFTGGTWFLARGSADVSEGAGPTPLRSGSEDPGSGSPAQLAGDGAPTGQGRRAVTSASAAPPTESDPTAKAHDGAQVPSAPESPLRGRVVAPDGSPVEGAHVVIGREVALRFLAEGEDPPDTGHARSDAEGAFRLPRPEADALWLTASAPGHACSAPLLVDLTQLAPDTTLELQLRVGGRIHGEVQRPDGTPIPGRKVRVMRTAEPEHAGTLRWLCYVHADERGHFEARDLAPGPWSLVSVPEEDELADLGGVYAEHILQDEVDLPEGGEVWVALGAPSPDAVRVHGRVTLDGQPAKGLLQWIGEFADPMNSQRIDESGEDGRYEVLLPAPGAWYVKAMLSGCSVEFRVDVPAREAFELDLKGTTLELVGRVLDTRGAPVEGARVSHVVVNGAWPRMDFCGPNDVATTDADGRFRFRGLPAATYQVGASQAEHGSAGARVELREGAPELELTLTGEHVLEGLVLDPDGLPARGAPVWVHLPSGGWVEPVTQLHTNAEGRFRTAPLPTGEVALLVRSGSLVALAPLVRTDVAREAPLTLQLAPGATLAARVPGESGPERCPVSVVDRDGRVHTGLRSRSDVWAWQRLPFDSRHIHMGPLPPGTYRLEARPPDARPRSAEATVTGDETLEVTLERGN